jgi:hypothetical protein
VVVAYEGTFPPIDSVEVACTIDMAAEAERGRMEKKRKKRRMEKNGRNRTEEDGENENPRFDLKNLPQGRTLDSST